jgi:serine/threonine protein kinase
MSLALGARLGPYEILSVLGTGGMGEVYKARDTRLNRVVALKILLESLTWSAENRKRLIREARTTSALNHPNIVHVYDIGEHEATPFLAMEYVEGTTLEKTIGPTGLRIPELLKYALEVSKQLTRPALSIGT